MTGVMAERSFILKWVLSISLTYVRVGDPNWHQPYVGEHEGRKLCDGMQRSGLSFDRGLNWEKLISP